MGVAWGEVALLRGEVALLRGGAVGTALPVPPPRVLLRQGQRGEEVSLASSLDQGMAASPLAYHAIGRERQMYTVYMYYSHDGPFTCNCMYTKMAFAPRAYLVHVPGV